MGVLGGVGGEVYVERVYMRFLSLVRSENSLEFSWDSYGTFLEFLLGPEIRITEKGGLSLRGVAVTTGTATTAETVKTVMVVSWNCIL